MKKFHHEAHEEHEAKSFLPIEILRALGNCSCVALGLCSRLDSTDSFHGIVLTYIRVGIRCGIFILHRLIDAPFSVVKK